MKPPLGQDGIRFDRLGCTSEADERSAVIRRLSKASDGVSVNLRKQGAFFPSDCTFDARAGFGVIPQALIHRTGDVGFELRPYEAASFVGERGSVLHVRVDAPASDWLFADR